LTVESREGHGSLFILTIKDVEIAAAAPHAGDSSFDTDTISFALADIIVADDIDYNREILGAYLEPWNFNIRFACNGKEAVHLAEEKPPDLILLDIKMPVMDGYEASGIIKARDDLKDIPIIAVTASTLKEEEEAIKQTCDGYLRKPISQTALIKEAMKYLEHTVKEKTGAIKTPVEEKTTPPTESELKTLYELALDGNLGEMARYLEKLRKEKSQCELFCSQLLIIARTYQDRQALEFLKGYLPEEE
ncbi:MAG: response regulator, partial [bacterium]|nr:response regulator [bacterium]